MAPTPAEPANNASGVAGQKWALRLGAALLLGYAVITGFAVYEKAQLSRLEKTLSPTAVGDKMFFQVPQTFDPSTPLVNFEGRSLYFVDWKNMSDTLMFKAGMDDANSVAVYKFPSAKKDDAQFFYLKLKRGYYVQTKRQ